MLAKECWAHIRVHGRAASENLLKAVYHLLPRNVQPWVRETMRLDGRPCLSKEFAAGFTGYPFRHSAIEVDVTNFFDHYLYRAFVSAILPHLLRYEDKNSMAHSIESRVPFLDYRVVELAFSMPSEQKLRRGSGKFVLRNAMKGIVPESVTNRQGKIGSI